MTQAEITEADWNEYFEAYDVINSRVGFYAALQKAHITEHESFCRVNGKPERILDAGCGTGNNAVILAENDLAAAIHGIDISEVGLRLLARKCLHRGVRVEAVKGSITALPYPTGFFDGGVLMMNVLYSIPDYLSALGEISRVTRAGGVLTVSGPMPGIDPASFLQKAVEEIEEIDTNPEVKNAWDVVSSMNERLLTNPSITHQFTAAELGEILSRFGFRAYLSNQDHYYGNVYFVAAMKRAVNIEGAPTANRK